MAQKTENYWLFEAPVSKAIWHMAIPMMLGMSVNMIYNITDTFFIGKLNNTAALASITLLLPITTIFMAISNLFGTGGSTLFSRLLGSQKTNKQHSVPQLRFGFPLFSAQSALYYPCCVLILSVLCYRQVQILCPMSNIIYSFILSAHRLSFPILPWNS